MENSTELSKCYSPFFVSDFKKIKMKSILQKFKSMVRWLHLWLGLFSGIIVFIISITGCIYVFQSEISQLTESWRFVDAQKKQFVAPSVLLDSAKQYNPDIEPYGVTYSGKEEAAAVGFWVNNDNGGNYTVVFLNPYTAKFIKKQTIIGEGEFNFFRFILNGHRALWLPYKTGHKVVGYAVLIFVILLITGLIMWWPKRWNKKSFQRNFTVNWKNGFRKLNYDLHNTLGFYVTILALIIAITGLTWSFEWVRNSIHFVASGGQPQQEQKLTANNETNIDSDTINTANALDICFYKSLQQEPDPSRIYFSPNLKNKTNISFILYKYKGKYYNSNTYNYDINTLNPVRVHGDRYVESSFADKLQYMYYDLHTGGILGLPGKIIAFLVSLICASLPITGFIIWYKKKNKKQKQLLTSQDSNKTMFKKLFKRKTNAVTDQNLLILYGTKTGNAKIVASELNKHSTGDGIKPLLLNMSQTTPDILKKFNKTLIIVSTHDEGDPPPSARKFFKQLLTDDTLELKNLKFAICGLGDSDYDDFCEAAKIIEKRLFSLGATAFLKRKDCDEDFAEEAGNWIKQVLSELNIESQTIKEDSTHISLISDNLFEGKITKSEKLATDADGESTFHIEIDNFNRQLNFNAGDLIEILPKNPDWLVNNIADLLKTEEFNDLLKNEKEICRLNLSTVKAYAAVLHTKEDAILFEDEKEIKKYLEKANLYDLLTDYPSNAQPNEIIELLPSLKGRQYSVTNYQNQNQNELHLMIKTIRYNFLDRQHEGAASVYTCDNLKPGDSIHFKHIVNREFYLPEDKKAPLIFIGSGTGFAPIRAFIQEWNFHSQDSDAWIIWGEKNHHAEHKYFKELSELKKEKTNLYTDFISSREEASDHKYVQDLILSKSTEVAKWINQGAYIYLCGSKKMGKGVEEALKQVILLNKNFRNLEEFIDSGRYLASVY